MDNHQPSQHLLMQNKKGFFSFLKMTVWTITSLLTLLIAISFLPYPSYTDGFRNLTELKEYARTIDEWVKMDNDDVWIPIYENFYQEKFKKSFWSTLKEKLAGMLSKCFLLKKSIYSTSFFENIILNITNNSRYVPSNIIKKIKLDSNANLVIFGPIQGAFHSFVRCLIKLSEQGILTENLRLASKSTYLVFLGNTINRSPYTLETLSLVLKLVKNNPENVIYLKGRNESFELLQQEHSLKKEIAHSFGERKIIIEAIAKKYFDQLPIGINCLLPDRKELLLLSNLFQSYYSSNLQNLIEQQLKLDKNFGNLNPNAIISDIWKIHNIEKTNGVKLSPPLQGIINWNILSSPSEAYRKLIDFWFDSYAIVSFSKENNSWTLTHHYRDIRNNKKTTFNIDFYNLFTGQKINN